MKNFISMDEEYILLMFLQQATDAIFKVRESELREYAISPAEATALFVIKSIGNRATPTEIARWLFREPHSVSGLVSRMEKKGLVRRVNNPERKNVVKVALTEKGQGIYQQSIKRESINQVMSALSKEQRRQLASFLQTLRDEAIRNLGMNRKPPFPYPQ